MGKKRKIEVGDFSEGGKRKKGKSEDPMHPSLNTPQNISNDHLAGATGAENKEQTEGTREDVHTSCNSSKEMSSTNATAGRVAIPWSKELVNGVVRVVCKYCGEDFQTPTQALLHVRNEHPIMTVKCALCGKLFATDLALRYHFRFCEAVYECADCNEKLDSCSLLDEHAKATGHTPKTFACEHCPHHFNSFRDLFQHLQKKHQDKNSYKIVGPSDIGKIFKCNVCPYQAVQYGSVKQHHKRNHPDVKNRATALVRTEPRVLEMFRRRKERKVKCQLCDAMLKTEKTMLAHVKWAHSDKIPKCPYCGFGCVTLTSMRRHVNQVHKDRMEDFYSTEEAKVDFSTVIKTTRKQAKEKMKPVGLPKRVQCKQCSFKTTTAQHLVDHVKRMHLHNPILHKSKNTYPTRSRRNDNIPLAEVKSLTGIGRRKFPLSKKEEDNLNSQLEDHVSGFLKRTDRPYIYSCYTMISTDGKNVYFGTVKVEHKTPLPCETWVKDKWGTYFRPDLKFPENERKYFYYGSTVFTSPSSAGNEAFGCSEFTVSYKVVLLSVLSQVLSNGVASVKNSSDRSRGFYNTDVEKVKNRLFDDLMSGQEPLHVKVPLDLCGFHSNKTKVAIHQNLKPLTNSIPRNSVELLERKREVDFGWEDMVKGLIQNFLNPLKETTSYGSYMMITPNSSDPYFGTVYGARIYPCTIWKPTEKAKYYVRPDREKDKNFYLYGKMIVTTSVMEAFTPMFMAEFHSSFCHAVQSAIHVYTGEERVKPYNTQPKLLGFSGCNPGKLKLAIIHAVKTGCDPLSMKVPMELCPYFSPSAVCDWVVNSDEQLENIGDIGEFGGLACPTKYIEPLKLITSGPFGVSQVARFFEIDENTFLTFLCRNNVNYYSKCETPIPKPQAEIYVRQWESGCLSFKEVLDRCRCTTTVFKSLCRELKCTKVDFELSTTDFKDIVKQVSRGKVSSNYMTKKYGILKGKMDNALRNDCSVTRDTADERHRVVLCLRRSFAYWKLKMPYEKVQQHRYLIYT